MAKVEINPNGSAIVALIDAAHEAREREKASKSRGRGHLGASMLGHPCDRWIWLAFRWAAKEEIPGRVLRLFRRGWNEERTILSDLRAAGCVISDTQPSVNFGSHVSGSADAIIESGVPEAPAKRHVGEFKTSNRDNFRALVRDGVRKAKLEHWVQMQVYMHGLGIDRALYYAVCKDDDSIYAERVRYDADAATRAIERAQRIATADRMPPPISSDPTWYQCRFCPAHDLCHGSRLVREVNCRTCAHSTARADSTWHCARHDAVIPTIEDQSAACRSHVLHPDLVPWQMADPVDDWTAVYVDANGVEIINGEQGECSRSLIDAR